MGGGLLFVANSQQRAGELRLGVGARPPNRFRTTRWSLVLAAAGGGDGARGALDELYRTYFYPLYSLVARRRGPDNAHELTQAFFVSRFVCHDDLKRVERRPGGRFRGWLCTALHSFLNNQWKSEHRKGWDVGRTLLLGSDEDEIVSRASLGLGHDPEQQLRRAEVLALLAQVLERLRKEYCSHAAVAGVDAARRFDAVKRFLPGPGTEEADYAACANALGVGPGAVKQLVCKLRKRFGQLLHDEIRRRVDSDADVAGAKSLLCQALELPPPSSPEP
jgi:DNA-directed RNA polymerase specialized sigma24 family protein